MKAKQALCILLTILLVPLGGLSPALAEQNNFFIIPDSDTRYLTRVELWDWQYDALGYIYNEIFARHGRAFKANGKYDQYFSAQAWYQVNPKYRYAMLSRVEVANQQLAHQVLQEMRYQQTDNWTGKALPRSNADAANDSPLNFRSYDLRAGQRLAVYTGPGSDYYRSGNGRALVSTNEQLKIAGKEDGWLMVSYETNAYTERVGYVAMRGIVDRLNVPELDLYYQEGTIVKRCTMTDEPDSGRAVLTVLESGTSITLLSPYKDRWAYIEADTGLGLMRGFVPVDCVAGMDVDVHPNQAPADQSGEWEEEGVDAGGLG
ncbi:MAG: YARHG domain-containing protein [Clostridia bacterium]